MVGSNSGEGAVTSLPPGSGGGGEPRESLFAPGSRIGNYEIEALIGRGGMGEVYRARQLQPVQRVVALKVLVRRLDARLRDLFAYESQVLATMRHPAIAQIHDAGTTDDGIPWFAMELIEGEPLTAYSERHGLPLRTRLELFIRVCEGVRHAHRNGVIHRDLKPGNLLVVEVDGLPMPKIIDFGVAIGVQRVARADEAIGTPGYMSPEQAGQDAVAVDTRSDVWSLGIVLHHLLTGLRPEAAAGAVTDVSHARPSAQLSASGRTRQRAEQLGLPRRQLFASLRDDLDWVVAKATRRDRNDRYDSAGELAEDLRRFLAGLPLRAVPSSRVYMARKLVRRHRGAIAVAATVALALVAGLAAALYGLEQARRQEAVARRHGDELAQIVAFQRSMLEALDAEEMGAGLLAGIRGQVESGPPLDPEVVDAALARINGVDLARELIDRDLLAGAEAAVERDFAAQPLLASQIFDAIGQVHAPLGMHEAAARNFAAAADRREAVHGAEDPVAVTLRLRQARAELLREDFEAAQRLVRQLRTLAPAVLAEAGQAAELDRVEAEVLVAAADFPAAVRLLQSAVDRERARGGDDDPTLLSLEVALAIALLRSGEVEDARARLERLVAHHRRLQSSPATTMDVMAQLAIAYAMGGALEKAVPIQREVVALARESSGAGHPSTLRAIGNLASMLTNLGEFAEAEALQRTVLEQNERLHGRAGRPTLRNKLNLAAVLHRQERYDEALSLSNEVLTARTIALGERHPDSINALGAVGLNLYWGGRRAEGTGTSRQALELAREVLGDRHPTTRYVATGLAAVLLHQGREAEAVALLEALGLRDALPAVRDRVAVAPNPPAP